MMVKIKSYFFLSFLACLALAASPPAGAMDGPASLKVVVDGITKGQVECLFKGDAVLVDVKGFLKNIPGAEYYPMMRGMGFVAAYGNKINFAALKHDTGFCSCQPVKLDRQLERVDGLLLAPSTFLARSVDGTVAIDEKRGELKVKLNKPPSKVGDVVAQAGRLQQQIAKDFIVRQGQLSLANTIDMFAAKYVPDCNGNNAGFPYLIIQAPPSPRDNQYAQFPPVFQMDQDEAFVLIGYTPPRLKYFSYRSYLVNRFDQLTGERRKIYASLGDTINNYNIAKTLGTEDVYGRFIIVVSTGNRTTYRRIRQAAIDAGIDPNDIFLDIIAADIIRFGLGEKADGVNFLHRASLFANEDEKKDYTTNPKVEVLRLTPKQGIKEAPLVQQPLRQRATGITEQQLDPRLPATLEQLYKAILAKHGKGKSARRMDTAVWLEEGNKAIAEYKNVLGETRDTLYTNTPSFPFNENDVIILFGVNHPKLGKSVYSNMSCYGAKHFNGFGGITDQMYRGTAREYLPDVDPDLADKFYVWKFARRDLGDKTTFVVRQDMDHDFTGINYGDDVFFAFRSYIDKSTLVGPIIEEIVRDQAVLLSDPAR